MNFIHHVRRQHMLQCRKFLPCSRHCRLDTRREFSVQRLCNRNALHTLPTCSTYHCQKQYSTDFSNSIAKKTDARSIWSCSERWPKDENENFISSSIYNDIVQAKSAAAILEYMWTSNVAQEASQNPHIVKFALKHIVFKQYMTCERSDMFRPWLPRNLSYAFRTLTYTSHPGCTLQDAMAPVLQHSNFPNFLELLAETIDKLPNNRYPEIMVLLMYLGVDQTSPLMTKLYINSKHDIEQRNFTELELHSAFVTNMAPRDYEFFSHVLRRIHEATQNGVAVEDLVPFLCCVVDCRRLLSSALYNDISDMFVKMFVTPSTKLDPSLLDALAISHTIKCISKLFHIRFDTDEQLQAKVKLEASLDAMLRNLDNFEGEIDITHFRPLYHMTMTEYRINVHYPKVHNLLKELDKPLDDIELKDVSALQHAVLDERDLSRVNKFNRVLYQKLAATLNDASSKCVLDMNLASFSRFMEPKLLNRLRKLLVDVIENSEPRVVSTIFSTFIPPEERDKAITRWALATKPMDQVDNYGFFCRVGPYLIGEGQIPKDVFKEILNRIPNAGPISLERFAVSYLAAVKGFIANPPTDERTRNIVYSQLFVLQMNLSRTVLNNIKGYTLIERLVFLHPMCELPLEFRDAQTVHILLENINEELLRLEAVPYETLTRLHQTMMRTSYYSEEFMNIFLDKTLDVIDPAFPIRPYEVKRVFLVLKHLACFNFKPKRFDEFRILVKRAYAHARKTGDMHLVLKIQSKMCVLREYMYDELKELFKYETLQELDRTTKKVMADGERQHLLTNMAEVNREVALHCPHLNVPWFCKVELYQKTGQDSNTFIEQEILRPLLLSHQVLRSHRIGPELEKLLPTPAKKYLISRHITDYGHVISHLIALDGKNQFLPINSRYYTPSGREKWIAISVPEKALNADVMLGQRWARDRQLETLGYHVVQIDINKWCNFENPQERSQYLRRLILNKPTNANRNAPAKNKNGNVA